MGKYYISGLLLILLIVVLFFTKIEYIRKENKKSSNRQTFIFQSNRSYTLKEIHDIHKQNNYAKSK